MTPTCDFLGKSNNARHKKPGTKQCRFCDFIYLPSKHRQCERMVLLEAECPSGSKRQGDRSGPPGVLGVFTFDLGAGFACVFTS